MLEFEFMKHAQRAGHWGHRTLGAIIAVLTASGLLMKEYLAN